jgi:hypothetical protein
VQERNRAQQAVDEAREALAGAKKKKEKAAAQAALTAAEERLSAGEPNGCLNESPCSPLTRHGASIKKPFGAARALAAKEMGGGHGGGGGGAQGAAGGGGGGRGGGQGAADGESGRPPLPPLPIQGMK